MNVYIYEHIYVSIYMIYDRGKDFLYIVILK